MAVDPREGLFSFENFKGLKNTTDSRDFSPGDLEVAINCDIDDAQRVTRRKGYSAPVVSGSHHSLFANGAECFSVTGNALYQILPNWSTKLLRSGLSAGRYLSYASVADRTFYSNGVETGIAQAGVSRTWGLTVPSLPTATVTGGSLRPGRYQFVLTYLRNDRQESGAGQSGFLSLATTGGVAFSALSVSADATVDQKALYMSAPDGELLYRVAVIPNATTTLTVAADRASTIALTTQFLAPAPAAEHLGYYAGRVLAGAANRLRWSEPYSLELFDLRKGVPVIGRITMVAPVADGVWLGTEHQVIWLPGEEPEKFSFNEKASYGVIPGTLAYGDSELIGEDNKDPVAVFATAQGICVAGNGGMIKNMTGARYQYPSMDRGAGVVRRHRGFGQYVVALQGAETAANVHV